MTRTNKRYGWVPDLPDTRDFLYAAPINILKALPAIADLRSQCPPVYDQGQLGSCTANAIAGAIEFDQMKQGLPVFVPSRLFIYYNERSMEGTVNSDSGAMIRDGIKSVVSQGACNETKWPYEISQFTVQPSPQCYQDALLDRAILYQRLWQNLTLMKACLAAGLPFVFGFVVYQSFESQLTTDTGIVPMPQSGEAVLGGHACLCVGYDDSRQWFIFRNSWSDQWGTKGYGYMSYQYLINPYLASDFWTIKSVN